MIANSGDISSSRRPKEQTTAFVGHQETVAELTNRQVIWTTESHGQEEDKLRSDIKLQSKTDCTQVGDDQTLIGNINEARDEEQAYEQVSTTRDVSNGSVQELDSRSAASTLVDCSPQKRREMRQKRKKRKSLIEIFFV